MQLQTTTSALALIASFFTLATGHPLSVPPSALNHIRSSTLSVNQILAIAPRSSTCEGAPYPEQCRTAEQALPHIVASFQKYGINSNAEQATLIAIMAFETGDFKYNVNVVPVSKIQSLFFPFYHVSEIVSSHDMSQFMRQYLD